MHAFAHLAATDLEILEGGEGAGMKGMTRRVYAKSRGK